MATDTLNDTELLELAAKAAGIDVHTIEDADGVVHWDGWNPLTDDGDALRLAVKLDMKVYIGEAYPYQKDCADYPPHTGCAVDEDEEPDPYAATRLAIVRAAAEIGKSK